jgi:hypothetical protein
VTEEEEEPERRRILKATPMLLSGNARPMKTTPLEEHKMVPSSMDLAEPPLRPI